MIKKITPDISMVILPLEDSKKVYISLTTWGHKAEGNVKCLLEQNLTIDVETASWIGDAINTSLQEISRYKEIEKLVNKKLMEDEL